MWCHQPQGKAVFEEMAQDGRTGAWKLKWEGDEGKLCRGHPVPGLPGALLHALPGDDVQIPAVSSPTAEVQQGLDALRQSRKLRTQSRARLCASAAVT